MGTTILANGKGHFGPTDRNDQTGHSGPPSKPVPNIPVGPNRNGPFHLMYQPKLPEFWVEWKAPSNFASPQGTHTIRLYIKYQCNLKIIVLRLLHLGRYIAKYVHVSKLNIRFVTFTFGKLSSFCLGSDILSDFGF